MLGYPSRQTRPRPAPVPRLQTTPPPHL